MARFLKRLLLVVCPRRSRRGGRACCGTSPDPAYTAAIVARRFALLALRPADRATWPHKHGVDPLLIKAIVWRESAFQTEKVGTSGERGLMQVGEAAARDWAKAQKIETFVPTDLFDPKTNLDAGAWYFKKALDRWKQKADPVPFALAEYNAGHGRVERWIADTGRGDEATAADLLQRHRFSEHAQIHRGHNCAGAPLPLSQSGGAPSRSFGINASKTFSSDWIILCRLGLGCCTKPDRRLHHGKPSLHRLMDTAVKAKESASRPSTRNSPKAKRSACCET